LVYELVDSPSVFDLAWDMENGRTETFTALTQAQNRADDELLNIFRNTLRLQSDSEAAQAPIQQLFYHRLTGGRLDRFYNRDTEITLPDYACTMHDVRQSHWEINGQHYEETLDNIIERSIRLLNPSRDVPCIIGHGDAHNGNLFFQNNRLLYFDPAFAGSHHPLLDLTKPLFHNVFAMWMYFPREKQERTTITLTRRGNTYQIEHNYSLHPIREMFLQSKVERVLIPILQELKRHDWLREDWRAYLKSALFCCPFLTMDLADSKKFSSEISLLGLAMAVEMGAESRGERSKIDHVLDKVEPII
ncbi:MAG: hypothetical protein K8I82_09500, partial [Anaerolineae bacterium]|nr:hypothetical protein [Anaerolineae bacterium]